MQSASGQENSAPVLCEEILTPYSLEEMMREAFQKLSGGYFEDAREAFTHCLLLESNEARAYAGRGMTHFQLKDWSSAVHDYQKAKELHPEDLENWIGLGMSLAMENKIYEAIEVFETLLAAHPDFARGHVQLGQLYYRLGVISKGHAQMDLALASRPSLEERRLIEELQKEQKALDKKRLYRPDFEALRKQSELSSGSWMKKIKKFFSF